MEAVHEVVRGTPAPHLRHYLRGYTGYRYEGLEPGTHQGLPSGDLTFIISLDGPIDLVDMPGAQDPTSFEAYVGGLHLRPATVANVGHGAGISVELSPLGARQLFGLPAAALVSMVVDLRDLLGLAASRLVEQLLSVTSWPARFAALDRELGRLSPPKPAAPEVVRSWCLLKAAGGRVSVDHLAGEIGWSRRHLTSRFTAELGISPSAAGRLLRFERTCGLLDQGLPDAEAAAVAGYFDQSHMISEWQRLAGSTPGQWKSDLLRDRSAAGAVAALSG